MSALRSTSAHMAASSTKTEVIASAPLTPPPGVDRITFYTQQAGAKFAAHPPNQMASLQNTRRYVAEQEDTDRRLDRCMKLSQQMIDECHAALRKPADAAWSSQASETSLELSELKSSRPVALQLARLTSDGARERMQRTTDWVLVTPSTSDQEDAPSWTLADHSSSLGVVPEDSVSQKAGHVTTGTSRTMLDNRPADSLCGPTPAARSTKATTPTRHAQAGPASAKKGAFQSLLSFEVCWKW